VFDVVPKVRYVTFVVLVMRLLLSHNSLILIFVMELSDFKHFNLELMHTTCIRILG
jgi:hypothetical protein